jgi:hypothetical protein
MSADSGRTLMEASATASSGAHETQEREWPLPPLNWGRRSWLVMLVVAALLGVWYGTELARNLSGASGRAVQGGTFVLPPAQQQQQLSPEQQQQQQLMLQQIQQTLQNLKQSQQPNPQLLELMKQQLEKQSPQPQKQQSK